MHFPFVLLGSVSEPSPFEAKMEFSNCSSHKMPNFFFKVVRTMTYTNVVQHLHDLKDRQTLLFPSFCTRTTEGVVLLSIH